MRALAVLFALTTASTAHAIVGGDDDSDDPAVVGLSLGGYPYCTGTIIAPHTVLTAGHCLIDVGITITANAGADESAPSETFDVVDTAIHPDYGGEGKSDDVSLFQLDRATDIAPVPLSTHRLDDADLGKISRHVGFGVSDENAGDGRGRKRTVDLPITQVTSTFVFSGVTGDVVKQTCDGDSGGPGFFVDDDGEARLISIVSDGPNCHEDGWDIRVDSVRKFIDESMAQFEGSAPKPASGCGCGADGASDGAGLLVCAGVVAALRRARSRRRVRVGV
ncbi:MAG TPA: trypsin-like serine protease [Myxococcota bacterium]|jgi:trypsin